MKRTSLFILLLFYVQLVFAQDMTVKGIVTSEKDGLPIPGVTVAVKGSSQGTITDLDGEYSIVVPSNSSKILIFSFVGMKNKEVPVEENNVINVALEESVIGIGEVMVVAYGTTTRESFTGSASVAQVEDLSRQPVTSFEKALATGMPGVQVANVSGQPGSATEIRIRGIGSFSASKSPLFVIDGIPVASGSLHSSSGGYNPGNLLSTLSPGDIESITILKDAAAASLYGSRAANGVILITTKHGKSGVTHYNFTSSYGISDFAVDNYKGVSGEDFLTLHRESMENYVASGNAPPGFDIDATMEAHGWVEPEGGFVDWADYLFRKGQTVNADFSATGGNDKTQYYLSFNYFDQEGIAYKSDLTRYSCRANITQKLSEMFSIGLNIMVSTTNQNIVDGGYNYYNPMYNYARNAFPTEGPYLPDGSYRPVLHDGYYNIVRERDLNENSAKVFRNLNNVFIEFRPLSFLKFKSTLGTDWANNDETRYASPDSRSGRHDNGYVRLTNRKLTSLTSSNLLTYTQSFNSVHNINFIAGFEATENRQIMSRMRGNSLPNATIKSIGATAEPVEAYGYDEGSSLLSILSRLNYDFDSKYYISGSFRRDGSSKLGINERWANFWSVSGAWRIDNESFMDGLSFIDNLKLKVSYGTNGTLPPDLYGHMALYSYSSTYNGNVAAIESNVSNENLTWEKNANFNAGIDFGIFKRVAGSIEYFQRYTTDLLMYLPISRITGFDGTMRNIGEMKNEGWEFNLQTDNLTNSELKWNTTFSITTVKNEVVKLNNHEDIVVGRYIRREGLPYYSFYLPLWAGVNPANGTPQWYVVDEDGNKTGEITGDYHLANKAIAGKADPDFFGSIGNTLTYKGFDLSFIFIYSIGGQLYYDSGYKSWNDGRKAKYVIQEDQINRWQKPGDNATHPQRIWGGNNHSDIRSSRQLLDNNYLRLKNIMFSYTIPKTITQKLKVNKLTAYVQANNYFTWAQQNIVDPEQRYSGYTNFEMPNVKTLMFGLEIGF